MKVEELTRDQLTELKGDYLVKLADEGMFSEITGRGYDSPTWDDLANADDIVPDDVVFWEYDGVDFVEEDFSC